MNFKLIFIHGAVEEITGYTEDEFITGKLIWKNIIHPDDLVIFYSDDEKKLHTVPNYSFEREYRIVRKDGQIFWIHEFIQSVADENGIPSTLRGVIYNITGRKREEEKLHQSEEKFRAYIERAPVAVFVSDLNGRFLDFNPAITDLLGYEAAALKQMNIINIYPEEEHEGIRRAFETLRQSGYIEGEFRLKRIDGTIFWVLLNISLIEGSFALGYCIDITERKLAEERMSRLNRELRAISICNQALLKAVDEQTLLNEICRIICEEVGYRLSWVGYAENDEAKTVRPIAWAGFDSGYIANAKLTWSEDSEHGKGPAGRAIRSGEAIYVQDFLTDPLMVPWRESAIQHGYQSGVAIPLKNNKDEVFGVLLIYSATVNAITSDEVFLLKELAGDLAFGIISLRTNDERKRAEEKLLKSEERYRKAQTIGHVGSWEYNIQTTLFWGSNEAKRIYGFDVDADTFSTDEVENCIPERERVHQALIDLIEHDKEYNLEFDIITTDTKKRKTISSIADLERDEEGRPIKITGSIQDITERKKIEELLLTASRYSRSLIEASLDPLVTINPAGKITDVNEATEIVTGVLREKLIGEDFTNYFTEPDKARAGYQKVLAEGLVRDYPLTIQHSSGRTTDVLYNAVVYKNESGEIAGVFAAARDITERKKAEDERKEHIRFLEGLTLIDESIKRETDVEKMLKSVVNTTFSFFDSDRAWLVYPCDPDAPSFRVPVEVSKPEYPGANILDIEVPMYPDLAQNLKESLEADQPVTYIAGTDRPINKVTAEQFGVQSQIMVPIYPKIGKPWIFGMHQCSYARVWTQEEKQLFREIGRRVADALTSLLTFNKLKESEERFRRLTENARDVIYRMSLPDGKYEYVSPAVRNVFGYQPEEFYETPSLIKQIIHPDWNQYFEEQWANLIKGEMPPTYEYQIIHKSGEVRWINQRNILVRDNNGRPIAIEAIVTDITRRKNVEDTLRESERAKNILLEKFDEAQHIAMVGSWEWDLQTNLVWWSDETYLIFGLTKNDFVPNFEADSKFIHPDDLIDYHTSFEHSLQTGEPLDIEIRIVSNDGIQKYCQTKGKVIKNDSGQPISIIGTIMDITERKRISDNLKRSEEYYRLIIETTNAVFYRLKYSTMKYEHLHPAIKKLTGYTPEEINEIGFKNIVVNISRYHVEKVNIDLIVEEREEGKTPEWQADYQVRKKDGKLIWLADHSYPWFNESGDLEGSVGFLIDITERKQAEKAIKESEKKYAQFVETTMEGILAVNNNREISFVNKRFAEMIGYELKEIIGCKLDTYFFAEDLEDHRLKMANMQQGLSDIYERRFKRKDGATLWVLISASPIFDDKGNYDGSIGMLTDITRRKHDEEMRMREQLLLRTVIDNLPDAIYAKDIDGRKILANLADLENIGAKSEAEVLNKTDFDVFPNDVAAKFFADDQTVIQTGKSIINREEFFIKSDGQKHWLTTSKLPLKDEKGNISGLVGIGRDITKRKQAEELIKLNIERLDRLLNIYQYNVQNIQDFLDYSLNEAIEITSSKIGYIYFYNEEKQEFILNSWSKEVMNECKVTDPKSCYELDKTGIWGEAVRQRKEIIINNFQDVNALKKGYPEGHVELTKYLTLPIFDGDEIVAVIGVANKESDYDEMDVMQLRLMMNSVWRIVKRKESEDKAITLSKAVEQNPVSIVITDPDGIIEYVNPSFEKLSGYNSAEIIGKNPRILKSGYHTGEFYKNLWTTIKAGNDFKCEMKNRKKNGEFYWENTVLSPITNEQGKISHFIAVKEDITGKKKMVEELISAKEKAEEMSRLKSNFLANMSHELRTPLNGILGYADYLTSQLKEPELIETSQGIYDSGKRLSETLNFILDLSEAETEHVEILTADVDVIPLVKDTLRSFAKEAAAKNLRFETIIKEENIFARIETRLFNRILYNLLDNALKFTKKGIITFEIGRELIGTQEWFYFKVTDSGIGIAKDKIAVVWDEFRQVSEGLTRTYEGVGLGLTISKKAVELMQGVITVESELGVGSTFTVEFPALSFLPKKEEEIQVQRITLQDQPAVFQPGKEKTETAALPLLLYIEDDFANRNVVKFFLKNSCSVETVADGEEALQLINQKKYDVILVDINLGEGINGMDVVKEVLKMPQYADTPLIAVTAFAMEDDKTEFLKGGCTHYISKPFIKKELIDLVTGALKNK